MFDAAQQLGAHPLQLPAAEVFIQKRRGRLELRGGKVFSNRQDAVPHRSTAPDAHGQHPAVGQTGEMHVLQGIGRSQCADRYAHAA